MTPNFSPLPIWAKFCSIFWLVFRRYKRLTVLPFPNENLIFSHLFFSRLAMEQFSTNISRCSRRCRDDAKLYLGPDVFQAKLANFRGAYQDCVYNCCDLNIKSLPNLRQKLDNALESGDY